jgi:hypothetical protein
MQVVNKPYYVAYIYKWRPETLEAEGEERRGYACQVYYPGDDSLTFEDMKESLYDQLETRKDIYHYGVVVELYDWQGTSKEEYVFWPNREAFMENVAKHSGNKRFKL